MKTQVIVKELEEIAKQLGLAVRKEKGNFKGGRCIVGGDELIVLNRHHVPEMHVSILAEGLRGLPVDSLFVKPAVRKALEEAWELQEAAQAEGDHASNENTGEAGDANDDHDTDKKADVGDEAAEKVDVS